MPLASSSDVKFEIGHVLFIDIVGYSKGLINEQRASVDELNEVVRTSGEFKKAEAVARAETIARNFYGQRNHRT
jgi:hypothetical protein